MGHIKIIRCTDAERVAYGGLEPGRMAFCTDTLLSYMGSAGGDVPLGGTGGGLADDNATRVWLNTAQLNIAGGWTQILFDTASFDIASDFDLINSEYNVPYTGYYKFNLTAYVGAMGNGGWGGLQIQLKAGAVTRSIRYITWGVALNASNVLVDTLHFTVGDVIEFYLYHNGPGGSRDILAGEPYTHLEIVPIVDLTP